MPRARPWVVVCALAGAALAAPAALAATLTASVDSPRTAIRRAAIVSQDGDTLTLTGPGLVGRRPACLNANLSRNRVIDGVTAIPFTSGGTAGEPTPTPTPEPPPLRVGFTHADARLTPSRTGLVTIALEPFARAVSGSVSVRRGRTPLGRATSALVPATLCSSVPG